MSALRYLGSRRAYQPSSGSQVPRYPSLLTEDKSQLDFSHADRSNEVTPSIVAEFDHERKVFVVTQPARFSRRKLGPHFRGSPWVAFWLFLGFSILLVWFGYLGVLERNRYYNYPVRSTAPRRPYALVDQLRFSKPYFELSSTDNDTLQYIKEYPHKLHELFKNLPSCEKGNDFALRATLPSLNVACVVKSPKDYKVTLRWKERRTSVWASNVFKKDNVRSAFEHNWYRYDEKKKKVVFTGETTCQSASEVAQALKPLAAEIRQRRKVERLSSIDFGCGVASVDVELIEQLDIQTLAIGTINDLGEHRYTTWLMRMVAERGVPSLGLTYRTDDRVPVPPLSFDVSYCCFCFQEHGTVPGPHVALSESYNQSIGYVLEVERLLRSFGVLMLSHVHVEKLGFTKEMQAISCIFQLPRNRHVNRHLAIFQKYPLEECRTKISEMETTEQETINSLGGILKLCNREQAFDTHHTHVCRVGDGSQFGSPNQFFERRDSHFFTNINEGEESRDVVEKQKIPQTKSDDVVDDMHQNQNVTTVASGRKTSGRSFMIRPTSDRLLPPVFREDIGPLRLSDLVKFIPFRNREFTRIAFFNPSEDLGNLANAFEKGFPNLRKKIYNLTSTAVRVTHITNTLEALAPISQKGFTGITFDWCKLLSGDYSYPNVPRSFDVILFDLFPKELFRCLCRKDHFYLSGAPNQENFSAFVPRVMESIRRMFTELYRLIRPNGIIVLTSHPHLSSLRNPRFPAFFKEAPQKVENVNELCIDSYEFDMTSHQCRANANQIVNFVWKVYLQTFRNWDAIPVKRIGTFSTTNRTMFYYRANERK